MEAAEQEVQHGEWDQKYASLDAGAETVDTHDHRDRIYAHFLRTHPTGPPPGRLLDVGCADGHFLRRARDAGWEVAGLEASEAAGRAARERHDLEVVTALLGEDPLPDASFDLVTMWDVFEHLPDPRGALARIRVLLRPGGTVFLRVPNLPYLRLKHRIWTGLLGREKCFIPRVHFYNYSRATLEGLLRDAGLEPAGARVGPPEVYGSGLRRAVQYGFHALAQVLGPDSATCFSLEAWATRPAG